MRLARGAESGVMPWFRVPILCACLAIAPRVAQAQGVPAPEATSTAPAPDAGQSRPRHPNRLYVGMWTTHLKRDIAGVKNNWAIGVSYAGFFGASFLNSFGGRAYAGGLQRHVLSTERRRVAASLGFRLGAVTGYDRRLHPFVGKSPILPLVQPFVEVGLPRVGVELSYTIVVVSVAVSYKF